MILELKSLRCRFNRMFIIESNAQQCGFRGSKDISYQNVSKHIFLFEMIYLFDIDYEIILYDVY